MSAIYKSDRVFEFFDYVVGHGKLLLRSPKTNVMLSNIDIVFWGVSYIQLFSELDGVTIREGKENSNLADYEIVKKYLEYRDNYLFEIESKNEKCYIVASSVTVYENQLEVGVSCLIEEDCGEEIATSFTN